MRVARAAAEIALDAMGDLLTRRLGIALKQLDAGHDHPRRAVTALQTMALPETFLHRVQSAIGSQSFDGGHCRAIGLNCQQSAGLYRLALEQHRASAADAGFATNMCAGQFAMLA